ncbi:MAG TPA: hypothetical protein VEB43_05235 [Anaeromyxobacter sp.]|nr:hypothetical protein [Anaeromyxobacter sp.]
MIRTGARRPGGAGARGWVLLLAWVVVAASPARAVGEGRPGASPTERTDLDEPRWRLDALRFTVADDQFRRSDDAGFTSYQAVALQLSRGPGERLGLTVANQMITERGGMRRVDEGSLLGGYQRRLVRARLELELGLVLGLHARGDLGGAGVQDGYHALMGGQRLGGWLQDEYPDRTRVGPVWGGGLAARWPAAGRLALTGGAGGAAAVGGGVSRLRASLGVALATRHLRAEAGDEVWRFFGSDPFLTMPGGYVTGAFVHAPYLRLAVAARGVELEYEARANAGGSGQGISQLTVRVPLR